MKLRAGFARSSSARRWRQGRADKHRPIHCEPIRHPQAGAQRRVLDGATFLADGIEPRAHFEGRKVIVNFEGRVIVLVPTGEKKISAPVFSEDGLRFAVQVDEPQGCKLYIVHMATLERTEFQSCAVFKETNLTRARFI